MDLLKNPKCYTDICIDGVWFHHDHCTTTAYMLSGGSSPQVDLAREPQTEEELVEMLTEFRAVNR